MSALVWESPIELAGLRRGRLAGDRRLRSRAVVAAWLLAVAGVVVGGVDVSATVGEPVEQVVVVEAGQSLSALASVYLPDLPGAAGVAAIQRANGLDGSGITPGQRLVIPVP